MRDLMAGVSRRDADAVVQAVLQVASLRRGVDVNDFERALARFMAQHLAPGSQPDAAMFNAMLRLMFDYGITMPAEWSTFFRALIVLEGTLTTIAPGYSVIDAAESIAAQVGPQPHQPELGAAGACATSCCAPCRCCGGCRATSTARSATWSATASGSGSRTSPTSTTSVSSPRLVNRLVLAFLSGAIGLVSVGLIAIDGGPAFSDRTSLFRVFGYFGLFCATVLAMRVIVAVLRDGLN